MQWTWSRPPHLFLPSHAPAGWSESSNSLPLASAAIFRWWGCGSAAIVQWFFSAGREAVWGPPLGRAAGIIRSVSPRNTCPSVGRCTRKRAVAVVSGRSVRLCGCALHRPAPGNRIRAHWVVPRRTARTFTIRSKPSRSRLALVRRTIGAGLRSYHTPTCVSLLIRPSRLRSWCSRTQFFRLIQLWATPWRR